MVSIVVSKCLNSSLNLIVKYNVLLSGSVFVVSIDSATSKLAVSGGEDDRAFVWHVESGEVLLECKGES